MEARSNNLSKIIEVKILMEKFFKSNSKLEEKNELINQITNISDSYSIKEISDLIHEEARELTDSRFCYVAYIDPENKDSVGISFTHMTGECKMYEEIGEARFKVQKDGSYGGLLGYSLDTGISFYVHDIASHPVAHGLPPGHVPVKQFLSVPVIYNSKILGQIVLGNPEEDYNDNHLKIAQKIADFYSIILDKCL
jgi:GAF domain-containing protein